MLSRTVWQQYWSLSRLLHQPKTKRRGVLQQRQENKHAHHDKTFAHHGKYCSTVSRQHSTASPIKAQVAWEYACWDFQGTKLPNALGSAHFATFKGPNSQNVYSQLLRHRKAQIAELWDFQGPKLPKCMLQAAPAIKAKINWEHAFWDFLGPKLPKMLLRHSTAQIAWEYARWYFQVLKFQKTVYLKQHPPSKPRSFGSKHFGNFKGPKLEMCIRLLAFRVQGWVDMTYL